jgi:hypothetical protein
MNIGYENKVVVYPPQMWRQRKSKHIIPIIDIGIVFLLSLLLYTIFTVQKYDAYLLKKKG